MVPRSGIAGAAIVALFRSARPSTPARPSEHDGVDTADEPGTGYEYLLNSVARGDGVASALRWKDLDLLNGTLAVRRTLHRVKGKGLVLRTTEDGAQPPYARSAHAARARSARAQSTPDWVNA
jgi:hypothetical protein